MMKNIGTRQWIMQNEGYMKTDYTKDAIKALKEGKYDETIELCFKTFNYPSLLSKSTIADCFHYIGLAYLKKLDYTKSIYYYNISIEKYKELHLYNKDVYYERGLARQKINDYEGAKEDYEKAVSFGMKTGNKLLNDDITYDFTKDISKEQYSNFNIMDYFIMPDMNKYGKLAYISGNIKKDKDEDDLHFYNELLKNDYKSAEKYNNRGVYYLEEKDYQKALDDFTETIKKDSTIIEPYYNLALLYYQIEEYQKAKEYLDKYLRFQNNLPEKYIVYKNGGVISYSYQDMNTYIDEILKANIELKLQNYDIANSIYKKYNKMEYFDGYSFSQRKYKLCMELLPLSEGSVYQYINLGKYKKAYYALNAHLTSNYCLDVYNNSPDKEDHFERWHKWSPPQDDRTYYAYKVIDNAYIMNNIALLEYVMGIDKKKWRISAIQDINEAKDIAWQLNDIELYKHIIRTYNLINTNTHLDMRKD